VRTDADGELSRTYPLRVSARMNSKWDRIPIVARLRGREAIAWQSGTPMTVGWFVADADPKWNVESRVADSHSEGQTDPTKCSVGIFNRRPCHRKVDGANQSYHINRRCSCSRRHCCVVSNSEHSMSSIGARPAFDAETRAGWYARWLDGGRDGVASRMDRTIAASFSNDRLSLIGGVRPIAKTRGQASAR
jgi:hypothetical protein